MMLDTMDVKEEVDEPPEVLLCTPSSDSSSTSISTASEKYNCDVCKFPIPKPRIHYGGVSCYSCRAFFRRAVQRGVDEMCRREGGNCPISNNDRKQCPNCRIKQCIKIGMRRELVLNEEEKEVRFRKRDQDPMANPVARPAEGVRPKKRGRRPKALLLQLQNQPPASNSSRSTPSPTGFSGYENGGYGFDPGCSTSKYSRIESSRLDTSRLSRMETSRLDTSRLSRMETSRLDTSRLSRMETSRLDTSRLSRMETCRASLDEFIPKPEEENEDDYLKFLFNPSKTPSEFSSNLQQQEFRSPDSSYSSHSENWQPRLTAHDLLNKAAAAAKLPSILGQFNPTRSPSPIMAFHNEQSVQKLNPVNIPGTENSEGLYNIGSLLYSSFNLTSPAGCRSPSPLYQCFSEQPGLAGQPRPLPLMPPTEMPPATCPLQIDQQIQMKRFKMETSTGGFTTVAGIKGNSIDGAYSMAGSKSNCSTSNGFFHSLNEGGSTSSYSNNQINFDNQNFDVNVKLNIPPQEQKSVRVSVIKPINDENYVTAVHDNSTNNEKEDLLRLKDRDQNDARKAPVIRFCQSLFDFDWIISEEIKYRHKKLRMHSSSVQHVFNDNDDEGYGDQSNDDSESVTSNPTCGYTSDNNYQQQTTSLDQNNSSYNSQQQTTSLAQNNSLYNNQQQTTSLAQNNSLHNNQQQTISLAQNNIPNDYQQQTTSMVQNNSSYNNQQQNTSLAQNNSSYNNQQQSTNLVQNNSLYNNQQQTTSLVHNTIPNDYQQQSSTSLAPNNSEDTSIINMDDKAILDCVLKLDISFFEQLYTTEEKNFIQMQISNFWTKWKKINFGAKYWHEAARYKKLGTYPNSVYLNGYRSMAIKITKYLSDGPFVNFSNVDFESIMRGNIKYLTIFSLWNSMFSNDDQILNAISDSDEKICREMKILPFDGIKDVYKHHPVLKSRPKVFTILETVRSTCGLLKDKNILMFLITLQFCAVSPEMNLNNLDHINSIVNETRTKLRKYLSTRFDNLVADEAYGQVMKMLSLNKAFNAAFMEAVDN